MIRSAEPGEDWRWCYADDRLYSPVLQATDPRRTDMIEIVPGPHGPLANVLAVRRGRSDAPGSGLQHREALIYTLGKAAELEHLIMLQYLFAAFSLKRNVSEGLTSESLAAVGRWRKTLLEIAEQEMLHLALAQNLLTAVGAAPRLARPNFPMPAYSYPAGVRIELLPFGEAALRHFAFLERPEGMDVEDAEGFEAIAQAVALPHDVDDQIVPQLQEFDTIGQLYRSVQAGLEFLAERLGPDRLFIGPANAQATEEHFRWPELVAVTDIGVGAAGDRHHRRTGRRSPRRVARCPLRAPAGHPGRVSRDQAGRPELRAGATRRGRQRSAAGDRGGRPAHHRPGHDSLHGPSQRRRTRSSCSSCPGISPIRTRPLRSSRFWPMSRSA